MNITWIRKRTMIILAGAVAVTAATVGASVALSDDDGKDRPIPAAQMEQAKQAALAETGGGQVTETEVGDEESAYEVEVTLDDGSEVDVQLDKSFRVVGTEAEGSDKDDKNDKD